MLSYILNYSHTTNRIIPQTLLCHHKISYDGFCSFSSELKFESRYKEEEESILLSVFKCGNDKNMDPYCPYYYFIPITTIINF